MGRGTGEKSFIKLKRTMGNTPGTEVSRGLARRWRRWRSFSKNYNLRTSPEDCYEQARIDTAQFRGGSDNFTVSLFADCLFIKRRTWIFSCFVPKIKSSENEGIFSSCSACCSNLDIIFHYNSYL